MAYRNCDLILSVRDAEKNHDKWLKTRDMGIGGSDAAIILGYSSYKSPYQLWMEKTGQAVPPDLSGNQYIYWGHKNEPNIADWFQETTGKKVRKLGTLQNRSFPFMLANVDREVVGENAGLEIKTAGVSQYKKWQGDEIPDAYYCQCLHYMAVTGADRWYIAVLIGGNDPTYKVVERNEQDIQELISTEREFWGLVQTHTAPPIDGTASCAQALSNRYHGENKSIVLPDDAAQIIDDLRGDKDILEKLKEQITLRENQLKDMLGDAEVGTVGDYRVTWKATNPRETCSLSKIKKAAPDLYQTLRDKGFISIGKASRRFAIK